MHSFYSSIGKLKWILLKNHPKMNIGHLFWIWGCMLLWFLIVNSAKVINLYKIQDEIIYVGTANWWKIVAVLLLCGTTSQHFATASFFQELCFHFVALALLSTNLFPLFVMLVMRDQRGVGLYECSCGYWKIHSYFLLLEYGLHALLSLFLITLDLTKQFWLCITQHFCVFEIISQ